MLDQGELSPMDQALMEKAEKATEAAYAPYSEFHVGAAVQLDNGEVILGNNQENIAYPSGLCAERVAVFAAMANFPNAVIETIAVYAHSDRFELKEAVSPCGACRQVLAEYESRQGKPIRVILSSGGKILILNSSHDLLPLVFNPSGFK